MSSDVQQAHAVPDGNTTVVPAEATSHASETAHASPFRGAELPWLTGLAAVAMVALALRLACLSSQPFWLDEVCTYNLGNGSLAHVLRWYAIDVHPPLYGVLLRLWQAVAGSSEPALRSFSSLWSVVGVAFAALLTREVTGSRVAALVSGLLLAVSPLDIWFAQEARMYAQAACLGTIAVWVLWRWLACEGAPTGRRWSVAYGVLAALQIYTHYVAVVVVAAQILVALALFAARRAWRDLARMALAAAFAAASFLPWMAYVFQYRDSLYNRSVGWITRLPALELLGYLNHELFTGHGWVPPAAAGWFSVAGGGLLGVIVAAAVSTPSAAPKRRERESLTLLLWLAVGPSLLAAAVGTIWHPVYFRPRFSLFCLAPTVVALVVLLVRVRAPLRTVLTGTLAAFMALGLSWQVVTASKQGLPELRALATAFGEPDLAIFLPSPHQMLVHYYLPHPRLPGSVKELAALVAASGKATVWVGVGKDGLPPPGSADDAILAELARRGRYRLLGQPDGFSIYELRDGSCR